MRNEELIKEISASNQCSKYKIEKLKVHTLSRSFTLLNIKFTNCDILRGDTAYFNEELLTQHAENIFSQIIKQAEYNGVRFEIEATYPKVYTFIYDEKIEKLALSREVLKKGH